MDHITGFVDRIISAILYRVDLDIRIARIVIRIVCGIFLLIVCIWLIAAIHNRVSGQNELHRWMETTAVVKESETTGESLGPLMSRNVFNDYTEWYHTYTVRYTITAEGYAWGGPFEFKYSGSSTGEASEWAIEVPAYAYYSYPQEGDVISLIFDPDETGTFKVGTIEELSIQMESARSSVLTPIIFAILILVLALFDSRLKRVPHQART